MTSTVANIREAAARKSAADKAKAGTESQTAELNRVANERKEANTLIDAAITAANDAEPIVRKAGVFAVYMCLAHGANEFINRMFDAMPRAFQLDMRNFQRSINMTPNVAPNNGKAENQHRATVLNFSAKDGTFSVSKSDESKEAKRDHWLKGGKEEAIKRLSNVDWTVQADTNRPDNFSLDNLLAGTIQRAIKGLVKEGKRDAAKSTANSLLRLMSSKEAKAKVKVNDLIAKAIANLDNDNTGQERPEVQTETANSPKASRPANPGRKARKQAATA